jgi:Heat induced stress protein YflT
MGMIPGSTVVGVFENRLQAEQAIDELHHAGFADNQIGYALRGEHSEKGLEPPHEETRNEAATGAISGGIFGAIVGALAALLLPGIGPVLAGGILVAALGGAAIGAAAGGVLGALMDLGVTEEEARYYENEFKNGRTIVAVLTGEDRERANQAREILHRHGAFDAYTPLAEDTDEGASTGKDAADTMVPDRELAASNASSLFEQPVGLDPNLPGTLPDPDLREPRANEDL